MFDEQSSLRDLIRNPLAWLLAGALSVVLFVLFPALPASLEIALLAGLTLLLSTAAGRDLPS